jgi:hypothetical protein
LQLRCNFLEESRKIRILKSFTAQMLRLSKRQTKTKDNPHRKILEIKDKQQNLQQPPSS